MDRQFAALRMGGDEFLTKPIEDEHLVAAVRVRAERARALGELVVVDSLTGLLRHGSLKEQLATELVRARRAGTPVSFAMLDVDHFKLVNDSYGHPAGDRVLRSLARTLQRRVRKTDSIGRYGGEEFAVVLPDARAADAFQLLEEVREAFASTEQQHGRATFNVTLSGGVVEATGDHSPDELVRAADDALYRAKREGRNKICLGKLA
jgi:diguanylate cyclase (GGDEF)-like protein